MPEIQKFKKYDEKRDSGDFDSIMKPKSRNVTNKLKFSQRDLQISMQLWKAKLRFCANYIWKINGRYLEDILKFQKKVIFCQKGVRKKGVLALPITSLVKNATSQFWKKILAKKNTHMPSRCPPFMPADAPNSISL